MRIVALTPQSKWSVVIAVLGFLFIAIATLTPGSLAGSTIDACKGWCDDALVADFARNILLFMPLAFGLRSAGLRTPHAIVSGVVLSAVVELLQIRVIAGRDASLLDLISNSLGATLGSIAASHRKTLFRPTPRVAPVFLTCSLIAWIMVLVLGGWGVQLAPSADPYWGQRSPEFEEETPFLGELLSGRVNGLELPSGRMDNDSIIRGPLRAGYVRITLDVRPGPPAASSGVAPIVRVADADRREILMLGRGSNDLVFRARLGATALRLETPAFAVADAFPRAVADGPGSLVAPESLSAAVDHGRVHLAARSLSRSVSADFVLRPSMSWSFFLPWDYSFGPNAVVLSNVWLGALLLPSGYFAAATIRRRRGWSWLIGVAVFVSAAVAIVPLIFSLPAARFDEFVAALAGIAIGWAIARVVLRRERTISFVSVLGAGHGSVTGGSHPSRGKGASEAATGDEVRGG